MIICISIMCVIIWYVVDLHMGSSNWMVGFVKKCLYSYTYIRFYVHVHTL